MFELVALSFYAFGLLSASGQLWWVFTHGTYLARRWQEEGAVNLYHIIADDKRGFFVEVGNDEHSQRPVLVRSFVSSGPLEDYGHGVRLPGEWA